MRIREPAHESIIVKHFNQEYLVPKEYKNQAPERLFSKKFVITPCENCQKKVHYLISHILIKRINIYEPALVSKNKFIRFCSRKCLDEWFEKNKLRLIAEEI